jgi:hypothetical protein
MSFTRRTTDRLTANCSLTLTVGFEFLLVFKGLGIDLSRRRDCILCIYGDDSVMGVSCLYVIRWIENHVHFRPYSVNAAILGLCCYINPSKPCGYFMYHQVLILTNTSLRPHSVFVCFVWMSEQTAIISVYSISWLGFRRVRKIAKSDYALRHVCPSVWPHRTTRLPLDGFLLHLVFGYF